ncbi:MAG: hypothetical protein Q9220_006053 [cf. Caloplaca sp. 1 TL-2023]
MAAIASYPDRSNFTTQPSSVSQREPERWDYTGPSGQETAMGYQLKAHPTHSQGSLTRKLDAVPFANPQMNGNARPPSDPTQRDFGEKLSRNGTPSSTKAASNYDSSYLSPPKGGRFRPALSDKSRSGSEADSLLDLYGHPRSVIEGTEKNERDVRLEDLYVDQDDHDNSRWIHRDKLAMIESNELQEAGIKLPRQHQSKSSLRHKKTHSRNQSTTSIRDPEPIVPGNREGKRQKVQSPDPQYLQDDGMDFDLRPLEERGADSYGGRGPSAMYHQPSLRQSGSKIPLPKTSPAPSTHGYIGSSIPLPKNRVVSGDSNGGDEEGLTYNRMRSRSNSIGSRNLLDTGTNGTSTPPQRYNDLDGLQHSPPKQRLISKAGSVTSARPKTSNGPRNISEPQKLRPSPSTQRSSPAFPRPKSRNGLEARPATAVNRPEGEAPWIADMYKPDPRLPPEQQMLPTHAKRLQQEQKEREAKAAGLSLQEYQQQQDQQSVRPDQRTSERPAERQPSPSSITRNDPFPYISSPYPNHNNNNSDLLPPPDRSFAPSSNQWPLKVAPPIKPPPTSTVNKTPTYNNGSSPIDQQPHGGYSTVPKIQSTPPIGSAPSPKPVLPQAMVQEKPRGKKEGGGCGGCCVVM